MAASGIRDHIDVKPMGPLWTDEENKLVDRAQVAALAAEKKIEQYIAHIIHNPGFCNSYPEISRGLQDYFRITPIGGVPSYGFDKIRAITKLLDETECDVDFSKELIVDIVKALQAAEDLGEELLESKSPHLFNFLALREFYQNLISFVKKHQEYIDDEIIVAFSRLGLFKWEHRAFQKDPNMDIEAYIKHAESKVAAYSECCLLNCLSNIHKEDRSGFIVIDRLLQLTLNLLGPLPVAEPKKDHPAEAFGITMFKMATSEKKYELKKKKFASPEFIKKYLAEIENAKKMHTALTHEGIKSSPDALIVFAMDALNDVKIKKVDGLNDGYSLRHAISLPMRLKLYMLLSESDTLPKFTKRLTMSDVERVLPRKHESDSCGECSIA